MMDTQIDSPRQGSAAPENLFGNRDLARLIVPLLVEQLLIVLVGMVDTVMVAGIGEHAVSAVSLVDNVNILINQVFTALCTGGSVVAAQYLGRHERASACSSAKQLLWVSAILGLLLGAAVGALRLPLLRLIFGDLGSTIMGEASVYQLVSAIGYPFIAVYSAGAAMYRSMAKSNVTMVMSLLVMGSKLILNLVFINALGWGVGGAAGATVVSRLVGTVLYLRFLSRPVNLIFVHQLHRPEWNLPIIKRVLRIGVPAGIENGVFQLGKLLVLGLITPLGTAAIAANAVSNTAAGLFNLPGNAFSLALVTVVGTCMGAGQVQQAQRQTGKLIGLAYAAGALTLLPLLPLAGPVVGLFRLSAEASEIATRILIAYVPFTLLIWLPAYMLPNTLRAAGDAVFSMAVSMISMFVFRIGLSYLFIRVLNMGVSGVWYGMYCDWVVRATLYTIRYKQGKWKTMRVI